MVGGGFLRSVGGWPQVLSLRRHNEHVLNDERILSSGDFVTRIIKEVDEKLNHVLGADKRRLAENQRMRLPLLFPPV